MGKKFGLGKGLEALIPENKEENNEHQSRNDIKNLTLDINLVRSNENQPRKAFDEEKIIQLAESIKNHGVIQPIVVKKQNEIYIIVAGERRWRAAKYLGLKEIPAIISSIDDKDLLAISLIENIQRENLNPIEEAQAYKRLISDLNVTQDELARRLGKSRTTITNSMRLINLDMRVQDYIIDGILSEGHGRTLLPLADKEIQYRTAQMIIDDELSVRETEKIVKKLLETKGNSNKKNIKINEKSDIYLNDLANKLEDYFGTKVNLLNKKNKGKIEIEYYSQDDLSRILDLLNIK